MLISFIVLQNVSQIIIKMKILFFHLTNKLQIEDMQITSNTTKRNNYILKLMQPDFFHFFLIYDSKIYVKKSINKIQAAPFVII